MKITMLADISGLRDGKPWPGRGHAVTLPDDEAQALIDSDMAKKYEKADAGPPDTGDAAEVLVPHAIVEGEVSTDGPPAPNTDKAVAEEKQTPPTPPVKKAAAKRPSRRAPKKAASSSSSKG